MRWLLFSRRQETPSAQRFDALLDAIIEDFHDALVRNRQKAAELREATGGH